MEISFVCCMTDAESGCFMCGRSGDAVTKSIWVTGCGPVLGLCAALVHFVSFNSKLESRGTRTVHSESSHKAAHFGAVNVTHAGWHSCLLCFWKNLEIDGHCKVPFINTFLEPCVSLLEEGAYFMLMLPFHSMGPLPTIANPVALFREGIIYIFLWSSAACVPYIVS